MSLIRADARAIPLRNGCVQAVVTSPPYWALRSYPDARQIGLERTPAAYVAELVSVFAEVWRVLREDGTLWLVLGDCYHSGDRGGYRLDSHRWEKSELQSHRRERGGSGIPLAPNRLPQDGLKDKDLVGIPWAVAFGLRDAGWYLRSDVIWAKAHEFCAGDVGSTMPMGGKRVDRPTPAHEYVFLLSKSPTYVYDEKAVEQIAVYLAGTYAAKGSGRRQGNRRGKQAQLARTYAGFNERYAHPKGEGYAVYTGKRRLRDVWFISPKGSSEPHFAQFPEALVEPCILAGCPVGGLVLDPFCGSGTVGAVAERLDRRWVGVDLSYQALAKTRTAQRGIRF